MNIGGTNTGPSVTYNAYYDNGDVPFGTTATSPTAFSIGSLVEVGNGAYALATSGSATAIPLYSLTQVLTFASIPGQNTGDANLSPVPEPTSMLLLGSGLIGLALMASRRNKK
jgi:hypothetical protein